MSMNSWRMQGVGFPVFAGGARKVLGFFEAHRNTMHQTNVGVEERFQELVKSVEEDGLDEDEILDGLNELFNIPAGAVAAIMNQEQEVLGFEGCSSDEETGAEASVLYTRSYPWEMMPLEKEMTYDDIVRILSEYAKELGVPEDRIEDLDLEFWG